MEFLNLSRLAATRVKPRHTMAVLTLIGIVSIPGGIVAAHAQAEVSALKAALLSKFGLYVEWPKSAFSSATSPFNLCVAGEDPFGESLDKVIAGERINDRTVVGRRLKTVGEGAGCHILYIGGSDTQTVKKIIEAVRGGSVLTVSDAEGSASGAGIIEFVIKDHRVRFDIDDEAAAQNGLVISSKLLSLALNVKRRTSSKEADR